MMQHEGAKIMRFSVQEGEWCSRIEGQTEIVIRSEHLNIEV